MKKRFAVASVLVLAFAVGCERPNPNAPTVQEYEQRRAELAAKQGTAVATRRAPSAAVEANEEGSRLVSRGRGRTYDPTRMRDPFRSFLADRDRSLGEERGPLEQFDLSQLTVVAVVWGSERPRALVEDPSGRGYVVQEGTSIGKNDGNVIAIDDNTVLVRETYVDFMGTATQKEIEMRVRSATQGG